jgi:hypothetical protein
MVTFHCSKGARASFLQETAVNGPNSGTVFRSIAPALFATVRRMKGYFAAQIVFAALIALPAFADRGGRGGGGGIRPIDPPNFDGSRFDNEYDGGYYYDQPSVVVVDPKAEAERQKEEAERKKAERQKTLNAHNDPMGGFFDSNQDPKNMFSK